MRVTFNMMAGRVFEHLSTSAQRLLEAQDRASTGKRIQRPSDDVSGTGLAMNLRETLSVLGQCQRNVGVAENRLMVTSHHLDSIVGLLQEVRSLALSAANSTVTDEARLAVASQLGHINDSLLADGNAQYSGRYVFAGSKTDTPPLADSGSTASPYSYQGDSAGFRLQVAPGTSIDVNVTGDRIFNMGGTSVSGVPDVFETIRLLQEEIIAGDLDAVSARVADVTANLDNVIALRSQVGTRLNRLDSTMNTMLDSQTVFRDLLSKTEDIDLTQAVLELATREMVYQAAISASSRLLQLSLANQLR